MLELFHALAVRFSWLRPVALLVIAACGGLFVYGALANEAPDHYLTSGLLGVCWGLLLFVFISLFQHMPGVPEEAPGWWQRVRLRLRQWGYGLLGLATLGLTLAVVVVTVRVL